MIALGVLAWGLWDVPRRAFLDEARVERHRTDFTVYTEAGAAFFDGRDPYAVTNPRGWHYLYPPLFAILVAPLAALPTHWQGVVWFLASFLMAFGCWRECRRLGQFSKRIGWLAFLAVLFPALDCLQRGQVGIAVVYLLLLGYRLVGQARFVLGGVVLALPIAIKVTPALPVAALLFFQLVKRDLRSLWATGGGVLAGAVLFLVLVPSLLVGFDANQKHLETWVERVATNSDRGPDLNFNPMSPRNQSLAASAERTGVPRVAVYATYALLVLALLAATVRTGAAGVDRASVFGLACAASLVLSPISWGHHYVILLPAALFVPTWAKTRQRPRTTRALAVAAPAMVLVHYALLEAAGNIGLLGFGMALWVFAACVEMIRTPEL